jgi:bifunctional UDP-N-acetylglucosamine pyrophosphorylase/glucosamine-1-phosphate N-acetyltransferase
MNSSLPKVLHEVGGRTMLDHVVTALKRAGSDTIIVTVGFGREMVEEELRQQHPGAKIAVQEEQLGTGDAARVALSTVPDDCREVGIFCGDTPLLTAETIRGLAAEHRERSAAVTVLTAEIAEPAGYGRVIRDEAGYLARIVEEKDATVEERTVREINAGTYFFNRQALVRALRGLDNDNAQGEYYLPDTISLLRSKGERVAAWLSTESVEEVLGVNTFEQLAEAERIMSARGGAA